MTWLSPGMFTGRGVWYRVFAWESMCQHQRHPETPASSQHTPLGAPGLYIQTLLPGSPAASDGRLSLGDRILEVNGSSLMGVSYMRYVPYLACNTGLAERVGWGGGAPASQSCILRRGEAETTAAAGSSAPSPLDFRAVDLIRHGGKKMRFLVAKSDVETAKKIRFRKPPS